MTISFGGDNVKCFFSVEKSTNSTLYDFNSVLKALMNPKNFIVKEDIRSIIFEEIDLIKWESFISEVKYWFHIRQKKLKFIKYTFSSGRNHYSAQFIISKTDFLEFMKYVKKINVNEIDQFWLFEKPNGK